MNAVSVEELGLLLPAVAALSIPPGGAVSINDVPLGSGDSQMVSGEADQRAIPLLIPKGGRSCEGDLRESVNIGRCTAVQLDSRGFRR